MLDLKNVLAVMVVAAILLVVWIGVLMFQNLNRPVTVEDVIEGVPLHVLRQDLKDTLARATVPVGGPDDGASIAVLRDRGRARQEFIAKIAENQSTAIAVLREIIFSDEASRDARETAVQALLWVQSQESVYMLGTVLMTHPDDGLRALAARLLGKKATSDALHYLLDSRQREKSEEVRKVVAFSLGSFGDEAALENLITLLLTDPSRLVRRFAASSIGKLGPERGGGSSKAVGALMQALRYDPSNIVRVQAVRSLAAIGPRDLQALLESAFDDEKDAEVRRAIEGALETLRRH